MTEMSIEERCRFCVVTKTSHVNLFRRNLSMKVMRLADVQIAENDGLPSTICIDCESKLLKCYEFISQVQWADKKFREMISLNQVAVEKFNVKQEHDMFENVVEMKFDTNLDLDYSDDGIHEEPDEERADANENESLPEPLSQVEPLVEEQLKNDNESIFDPLSCMKEEAVSMDTNSTTETSMPSSSVSGTVPSNSFSIWPTILHKTEDKFGMKILQQNQNSYFVVGQMIPPNTFLEGKNEPKPSPSAGDPMCTVVASGDYINPNSSLRQSAMISNSADITTNSALIVPTTSSQGITYSTNTSLVQVAFNNTEYLVQILPTLLTSNSEKTKNVAKQYRSIQNNNTVSEKDNKMPKNNSESTHISAKPIDLEEEKNKLIHMNESFCIFCNVNCGNVDLLKEHREREGFICRVCTAGFQSHAELETHFVSHQPCKCKVCNQVFFCRQDLFKHRKLTKKCQGYLGECEICNKRFYSRRSLKLHKRNYHGEREDSYKCIVCGKMFKVMGMLNSHMKWVHTAYEHAECTICHKSFLSPERLKIHVKCVHLYVDEPNAPFVCSTCGKVFKYQYLFDKHQATHDETVSLCEICGKSVKGIVLMKSHMANEHPKIGSATFTCNICNKVFYTRMKYRKHTQRHSRLSTPAYCEICGKEYKSKEILKSHRAIHFDEKPFKCKICDAAFKQKVSLVTHGRVHSNMGKYFCNDCGMSFKWKQTFDKHVKKCEAAENKESVEHSTSE